MDNKTNVPSMKLLSGKLSEEKEYTKQTRAVSECHLFCLRARVSCLPHVELSSVGVLRSHVGVDAFPLLSNKHATRQMFTMADPKHPSPDLVSALCSNSRGHELQEDLHRVDDLTQEKLRKDQFGEFSSALLYNPSGFSGITNILQES